MSGDDAPLAMNPPGRQVAVNEVIGDPPVAPGEKEIVAMPFPGVAVTPAGGAGALGATLKLRATGSAGR